MRRSRIKALSVFVLVLVISGCGTTRQCPSFFHPDYANWSQQAVGETITFTDQNGVVEQFDVTEIERGEPFSTEGFGSRESDIVCRLKVRERLVKRDSNETLLKLFEHAEFSDKDVSNEVFSLSIKSILDGEEEARARDFLIILDNFDSVPDDWYSQSYHAELNIGGERYSDVITIADDDLQPPLPANQITGIAFASGFGLVQYTRFNGSVFSRIP